MEETLKLILDKLNSMDSDIKGLKSEVNGLKSEVWEIKSEVKDLKKHVLVIENEHGKKLDALFDGYKQLYEAQQEMKSDIKDIKETLDVHELKLLKVK